MRTSSKSEDGTVADEIAGGGNGVGREERMDGASACWPPLASANSAAWRSEGEVLANSKDLRAFLTSACVILQRRVDLMLAAIDLIGRFGHLERMRATSAKIAGVRSALPDGIMEVGEAVGADKEDNGDAVLDCLGALAKDNVG